MSGANLTKLHTAMDQLDTVHNGVCDLASDCPYDAKVVGEAKADWTKTGEPISEAGTPLTQKQRDQLPGSDFAGKGQSFYIKIPQDVADAATSIGRAGADNYDAATLKANIIRIAKRKGAAFVAKLPASWKGTSEAADVEVQYQPLVEKAVRADGTIPIKIIAPGKGSSGYYSPQVLERDGPSAFPAGLKMFADHPTATEEVDRPERSTKDLVAVTTRDAYYDKKGAAGPGLYAEAKVIDAWRPFVEQLAPHIGLSIRANGVVGWGDAGGEQGDVVEKIATGRSIDFVTEPGAGGKVLELFESARQRAHKPQEDEMDEKELAALKESAAKAETLEKELAESKTAVARMQEATALIEAKTLVAAQLKETELPEITQERLVEQLSVKPVLKDGALDKDALKKTVEEAAKAEAEYLGKLGAGRITGMGSSGGGNEDAAAADKALDEAFSVLGLSESERKIAVAGR